MDWIGMLLFLTGSTLFALPLSWAGNMYPWGSWRTILPLVIGAMTLLIFTLYEARPAEPVFPYRIFRSQTAQMTLIGSFIHGMLLYTLLTYLPLFFQTASQPGQSTTSDTTAGKSGQSGSSSRVGVRLFALWDSTSPLGMTASAQVIAGIGIGTIFTVPPIPMQASAPTAED
ncbi:hypothetical protein BDV32DRAFT_149586 [Aspergillus pseudonomiae]|nr:hypothetical protein BDV32DRAFT_149586 [Aspergillus pseudonomiae]